MHHVRLIAVSARVSEAIPPLERARRAGRHVLLAAIWLSTPTWAQEGRGAAGEVAFFETQVRPLLAERCQRCHGARKQSGGLRLDDGAAVLAGGESGPAVVPGKPEESLLIAAVKRESLEMPPDGRLSDREVEILRRWVQRGAPWPDAHPPLRNAVRRGKITDEDRQWWAFQSLRRPQVPDDTSGGWARNEIDRFIWQRLHAAGLAPAPVADRRVLIRRLYYDLLGLPPSPEAIAAFVSDPASDATDRLIDQLLASEQYGERWARHWLDLVRYADSDGYRIDDYRPNAWRYRDYVIRSFNTDKPYDRFVQEQLAGDELFPDVPDAIIATGFLRHWIYEYNSRDVRTQWQIILDDITDTTGDVFLGLGLQCARCHDHKFDPILQQDYYRLQAFFAALLPRDDLIAATAAERADHAVKLTAWETKTSDLRRQIDAIEARYREQAAREAIAKFPDDIQAMIRKPQAERSPQEQQLAELAYRQVHYEWDRLDRRLKGEDKEQVLALRKQLAEFDRDKPPALPQAAGATDLGDQAAPVIVPKKGPESVAPGYLTIWGERPATIESVTNVVRSTGRRATLARWLTRPDHPLTSRVIVNRVWQQHFGRGLAANASDFGRLGEEPTHPELLDWLAAQFVADGWSLKRLHRRILQSATYQQAAIHPQADLGQRQDPQSRFYWRANVRRLDAEQIRDALYAVTGELDLRAAGGPGAADDVPRRSIYLRVMRNTRNPLWDAFDAPYWMSSVASRNTTTTPVQSLMLINSQFLLRRAAALAARVQQETARERPAESAAPAAVVRAFELASGRPPTATELAGAQAFLREQAGRIDPGQAGAAEATFLHDKIAFRDGQAAVISAAQGPFLVSNRAFPDVDFTIEAFCVVRSIYDTGAVRVVAAQWNGNEHESGWSLGVTGRKSRRKPQTLVLQLVGRKADGQPAYEPIFSDQHIQLNKPYYVGAAVRLARDTPGQITFYAKDLSNDDEPLLIAAVPHTISGGYRNDGPLSIGGRTGGADSRFDGLLDDVRLSQTALGVEHLLFTSDAATQHTIGYWRFEPRPSVLADASGHGHDILAPGAVTKSGTDPQGQAWIDFCHVLLNSNEFLYVP